MPPQTKRGGQLADQRYYHFVVIQGQSAAPQLASLWRKVGETHEFDDAVGLVEPGLVVQHRKLRSRVSYGRGAVAVSLSEKGDGEAPYLYDVFAGKVDTGGEPLVFLGFPFVGLARDCVRRLIDEHGLLNANRFVASDVPALVSTMETGFTRSFQGLRSHVVGLQFVVKDDKNLTAIKLGGDDPLSAEIYLTYLRSKLTTNAISPDHCVLAMEREWEGSARRAEPGRVYRSRVHFDQFGNVRFYAQVGCENVRLLPYALGQLRQSRLFRLVGVNPLMRLDDAETD